MSDTGIGDKNYFLKYYSSRNWQFYNYIIAHIVQYSQPGPLLDIGAGSGLLIECAANWGMNCLGLEGSKDAIALALKRCPSLKIQYQLLSEPFPFADNSFQTVIMNQTIEHLEPSIAEKSIAESCRVLKPGGMIYIASPNLYNKSEALADPTHINLFTPSKLKKLLLRKGFANIVPLDNPLYFLGKNFTCKGILFVLFKIAPWDRLSATANCIAFKPINP